MRRTVVTMATSFIRANGGPARIHLPANHTLLREHLRATPLMEVVEVVEVMKKKEWDMQTSLFFCRVSRTKVPHEWWKQARMLALFALFALFALLCLMMASMLASAVVQAAPAHAQHAQTGALPDVFSMRNVMMDNRGFGGRSGDGGSLLVGARVAQSGAAGYAVRFTVENVGAVTKSGGVGCVNDWITLLHSDENHNVALRLRCNQLELHAHNDYAQGDLAGPVIPFNFSADTPISLVVSVRGQTVTVATASGAPLVQWQAPAAYPLPASGRSVVLYVAGGSTACWEAVDGAPLS